MKYKVRVAVLSASVLIVLAGGQAIRANSSDPEARRTPPIPLVEASVTVPDPRDPVVVPGGVATNTRGVAQGAQAAVRSTQDIPRELMNAYMKAVAVAPAACHLSVSLLAAIGQVESGNLANRTISHNRVVPAVLGPVLDGGDFSAIKDTDDGRWDRNKQWDRALGPMQIVPASWRVVGFDLDEDGVRDPQDVFDAAGAAMVYLCADGRDLATTDGLTQAVLAYNHSQKYLRLVLGWKTVFDAADITGLQSQPAVGAWAMPAIPQETQLSGSAAAPSTSASEPTRARTSASAGRGTSTTSSGTPRPGATGRPTPSKPSGPSAGPSASADPEPSTSPDPTPDPTGPTTGPSPTCLPLPSESASPGEPSPSASPSMAPSLAPGDEATLDPCAVLTPSEPADGTSAAATPAD